MNKHFTKPNNLDNQKAWSSNAERLAKFVVTKLINRTDAYGRYRSLDDRDRGTARTVGAGISGSVIQQHFHAEDQGHLVGLHTTSPDDTCRWMVIDIDHHGDPDANQEGINEAAAIEFYEMLAEAGLDPLLLKSNGRGGFHIWVIFDKPVPAEHVYRFGNAVVEHWQELQLPEAPEVFPKQPSLNGKGLGNWVRLPGRHHTHDFYTEVWENGVWLAGQAVVDRICNHEPVPAEFIKDVKIVQSVSESTPPPELEVDSDDDRPINRVLSRLKGVKRSGAGNVALCPNHNDIEPSLSISESKEGHALLHCFAGCEPEEIVEAIGLQMSDLFADKPDGTDRELRHRHPKVANDKKSKQLDLAALHQSALAKTTPKKIEMLANSLGVSVGSLQELRVAWSEPDGCWLFPERDHKKKVIGLLKRFPNGTKRNISGGNRGLYIPKSFSVNKPRIIIAEGGSDTAAGLSRGWNVIGRPSAFEGVSLLVRLLKSASGKILVIGDNDAKRDGTWPGMHGAKQAAEQLADELRTEVLIDNPPMKFKDLREWHKSEGQAQ